MNFFAADNNELVLDSAKLSKLVYASEAEISATWKEVCPRLIEKPMYFSSSIDAQAIGCLYRLNDDQSSTILIIAYRGTSSLTDARADANVGLVSLTSRFVTSTISPDIQLHRGFFAQYASLEKDILTYMTRILREKDYLVIRKILFTGHSLAASVSSIAASIPKLLPTFESFDVGLITFGTPRTGLSSFSQFLKENVDWILQVKNSRDPVISLLPNKYGYMHPSPHFRQIGKPDPFPDSCNLFDLYDHKIDSYIKALQQDPLGINVPSLSWADYIKGKLMNKTLGYLQSWAW